MHYPRSSSPHHPPCPTRRSYRPQLHPRRSSDHRDTHPAHGASLLELTTELQAPAPAPAPRKSRHKRSSRRYAAGRSRSYGSHYRRRSGGSGFSYDKMEIASSTPALIKSVVDHGQQLLGLRYRTSGVAKWPLDCSGFVSYIYSLEASRFLAPQVASLSMPTTSRTLSQVTSSSSRGVTAVPTV